jgi:hypothetical protein
MLIHFWLVGREVRRSKGARADITPQAFLDFKAQDWNDLLLRYFELIRGAEVICGKALKEGLAEWPSDPVDVVKMAVPSCWLRLYYRLTGNTDQDLIFGVIYEPVRSSPTNIARTADSLLATLIARRTSWPLASSNR